MNFWDPEIQGPPMVVCRRAGVFCSLISLKIRVVKKKFWFPDASYARGRKEIRIHSTFSGLQKFMMRTAFKRFSNSPKRIQFEKDAAFRNFSNISDLNAFHELVEPYDFLDFRNQRDVCHLQFEICDHLRDEIGAVRKCRYGLKQVSGMGTTFTLHSDDSLAGPPRKSLFFKGLETP